MRSEVKVLNFVINEEATICLRMRNMHGKLLSNLPDINNIENIFSTGLIFQQFFVNWANNVKIGDDDPLISVDPEH